MNGSNPMDHPSNMDPPSNVVSLVETTQCTATSKQTGQRCRNKAIPGGTVCRFHGGNAPQVRAAALARITEARDLALTRLIEGLDQLGDAYDPRTLLDVVVKLTDKEQLLEGKVTTRSETIKIDASKIRAQLDNKLDELAARKQNRL